MASSLRRLCSVLTPVPFLLQDVRQMLAIMDGKFYNDITPTVSKFWPEDFPIEMESYTKCLVEAYSCVGGDVACNAAPAIPSVSMRLPFGNVLLPILNSLFCLISLRIPDRGLLLQRR